MGYIVTRGDIPDLPLLEVRCDDCNGTGGQTLVTYSDDKERQETFVPRSCDRCRGTGNEEFIPVHMECRSESIVLVGNDSGRDGYDGGRLEITYRDVPYLLKLLGMLPIVLRRREGER